MEVQEESVVMEGSDIFLLSQNHKVDQQCYGMELNNQLGLFAFIASRRTLVVGDTRVGMETGLLT